MAPRIVMHVGDTYGKWTVVDLDGIPTKHGKKTVICQCSCGKVQTITVYDLKAKKTSACLKCKRPSNLKHGHSRNGNESLTHSSWRAMIDRCENPKSKTWKWYGDKGVTVCERWHTFEYFLEDMGSRPTKRHTIDRKENTKGYKPENCMWSTWDVQMRHRSQNRLITFNGVTHPLITWAELTGFSATAIRSRLNRGWTEEEALTTPVRPMRKRKSKPTDCMP